MKLIQEILIFQDEDFYRWKKKDNNCTNSKQVNQDNTKTFIGIVFSAGIVPCPGAAMILLFTLNMNILYAGIISVLVMSLGMALTISSAGIITIATKKYSIKYFTTREDKKNIIRYSTAILSSAMILFIGIILFLGNLS